jgi:hypothetical protein
MVFNYGFLFLFAFLGAGLKTIDDIFDRETLEKKTAYLLAPILVFLWIFLSISDKGLATLLGAILLSSLVSGKVDNYVFKLSAVAILLAGLLWGVEVIIAPFFVLTFFGIIDEYLDGYCDKKKTGKAEFLLKHRIGMKIGVLILYVFSQLGGMHVLAMFLFDLAYDTASGSVAGKVGVPTGAVE